MKRSGSWWGTSGLVLVLVVSGCGPGADGPAAGEALAVDEQAAQPGGRLPGWCAKRGDADGDGHAAVACGGADCDDRDPLVHPGAAEVCGNAVDEDCDGVAPACEPPPGCAPAEEICGDGVDQDCDGSDEPCSPPSTCQDHACLTYTGPGMCVACHAAQAQAVVGSQHYQWRGPSPDNVNGASPQGKLNGVNSYCVAVEQGNWGQCNGCHVGRGAPPSPAMTEAELRNVDCLLCHQAAYRRKKDSTTGELVPDPAAMAISMDEAVRTVKRTPERAACLQCHAKAGGGDAYKRGDLALAHGATTDRSFDVHMATTGADLACTSCHRTEGHRIAGGGTDLRASDSAAKIACTDCHAAKATSTGHGTAAVNRHVARVACQTCHIPRYARNASDTPATEATETHRVWRAPELVGGVYHPTPTLANDLRPRYAFWNGKQDTMLLGDAAAADPATGAYPTSRPVGGIADPAGTKLFPFKYKTAEQPLAAGMLTPVDMAIYRATGDALAAARQGAVDMGLAPAEAVTWVTTDTMQLLNHEVAPRAQALGAACTACHGPTATQMSLPALGYVLKGAKAAVCSQCHSDESYSGWQWVHDKHVTDKKYDCRWCHAFSRPERGLR